ncbi:hypothetical protein AX16_000888 [Volvariella volvacea WC 439]|nr:hypothetical protein AX16_000888 [Volvariella volvacea WC 439]
MFSKLKPHHRPLARHRVVSVLAFLLLLFAFILLLLVAVSLPLVKPVYLLSLESTATGQPLTSIATELRFGVWGVCASSALREATLLRNPGVCFGPRLGYDVPLDIAALVGISPALLNIIQHTLLVILVLHPVSAGFSFLGFLASLFLGSHALAIINLIISIITAILTSIVFSIDLALVLVARSQIKDIDTFHFAVEFGTGVWMVMAAMILTWLAVITLSARACYCCGVRKYEICDEKHHDNDDL